MRQARIRIHKALLENSVDGALSNLQSRKPRDCSTKVEQGLEGLQQERLVLIKCLTYDGGMFRVSFRQLLTFLCGIATVASPSARCQQLVANGVSLSASNQAFSTSLAGEANSAFYSLNGGSISASNVTLSTTGSLRVWRLRNVNRSDYHQYRHRFGLRWR